MSRPPSYDRVLQAALEPWAMTRPMLAMVAGILARRLAGGGHETVALEYRQAAPPTRPVTQTATVVLPIHGVIAPRMTLMSDISGGTSFDSLTVELREAVADPNVGTIVLDVDSPGGSCGGATGFAREVLKARASKTVIACAEHSMCSAAYWVCAGATQIVASPDAHVGSIGVYTIHEDLSKFLADLGVSITYLSAGKFKVAGNETVPLDDETRTRIQKDVDATYSRFVNAVARGRGVPESTVRTGYGEGAVVNAEDALALGMIDRIETLDETIARVTATGTPPALAAAATPQELSAAATGQERQWAVEVERAFLDWAL